MNERSSRSHTILTLYVSLAGAECDPEAVGAASGVVAQLNLVDLAGSGTNALWALLAIFLFLNFKFYFRTNCVETFGDANERNVEH
jgi:hypothetical protein